LEQRVALVSAGVPALVIAQAELLAARGVKLVMGDVEPHRAAALADAFVSSAPHVLLDPTSSRDRVNAVAIAASGFGDPSILINNAGRLQTGGMEVCTARDAHAALEVNLVHGCLMVGLPRDQ
jgi:NAD(P)-dependent dehydrogenase (short-subunit alcohol dehydrogenase family)